MFKPDDNRINGEFYSWSSISLKLPFGDVIIQSIDYGDELEKELAYGMGSMPRGFGRGNYKASCKLSFKLDDWEQIEEYCREQNVSLYTLFIPKIIVAYANTGTPTRIDEIIKVGFTKVDNKAAQGDKGLNVDVECIVMGEIIRNSVNAV